MIRAWVGVIVIACMLAGCGSTVTGKAVKAGAAETKAGNAAINPGNFPTKPHPPFGNAGSIAAGSLVEARRMGENTILTFQVDPAMINAGILQGAFSNPAALTNWFSDPIPSAVGDHNFIAGFLSDGATKDRDPTSAVAHKELMNTVLRFATPDDAAAATQEMLAKSADLSLRGSDISFSTHPIAIPQHPTTAAVTYTSKVNTAVVLAYTAHGTYVLGQYAGVENDPQDAANLVAAAIDQQLPLIDAFAPTPPDQLASLPIDPTGLMAHTIPPLKGGSPDVPGDYGAHAVLAFQDDAARTKVIFDAVGVDVATQSRANVYRARDAAGAAKIVDDFADEATRVSNFSPADGVGGLPDSRCLTKPLNPEKKKQLFRYCLTVVDRYAIEVGGPQSDVVNQIIAAQYLMLKAP